MPQFFYSSNMYCLIKPISALLGKLNMKLIKNEFFHTNKKNHFFVAQNYGSFIPPVVPAVMTSSIFNCFLQ